VKLKKKKQTNFVALVCKRTIPAERLLLVSEVSANFSGWRVSRGQRNESPQQLWQEIENKEVNGCAMLKEWNLIIYPEKCRFSQRGSLLTVPLLLWHVMYEIISDMLHIYNENSLSQCSLTSCLRSPDPFLRSHQSLGYSKFSQHFMQSGCSLSCSKEPSTGPSPKPHQSSPYHPLLAL
jgi:hypothetical protein